MLGPGGALARVPLPTPAARMWALGPNAGLLLAGRAGGGLTLAHPLDAPEPVSGWGPGAAVAWVSARDGLALTAGGGGGGVALWSLREAVPGSGSDVGGGAPGAPGPAASPLASGCGATPATARRCVFSSSLFSF